MKKLEKPLFTKLIQVGMAVKSVKDSIEKYTSYGIGPWYVLEFNSRIVDNMMLYGKRKDHAMLVAVCPIGDVRFELIEPLTGSIYTDYMDKYGDSIINHLKLGVDDYDFAVNYLQNIGLESIQSGHQLGVKGKNIYNYFDTFKSLGFLLEIVNVTEDFIKPEPQYWYPSKDFKPTGMFKDTLGFTLVTSDLKNITGKYSELFGMDKWETKEISSKKISDAKISPQYPDYIAKAGFHELGKKYIKIIEAKKDNDNSIFSDFNRKYGTGVVHSLAMDFENIDSAVKLFSFNGLQFLQKGTYSDRTGSTFVDTSGDLNFITELIYRDNKNPS